MTIRRPIALAWLAWLACLFAQSEAQPSPPPAPAAAPEIRADMATVSAIRLFAGVEEAWASADVERLTSLVDTTAVRIAIKPGAPLTSALTRVAAAFLMQDQLRLVHTQGFQIKRFDCEKKRRVCRAFAVWTGDWGGRQGTRAVRVTLVAQAKSARWLLTEIRAED